MFIYAFIHLHMNILKPSQCLNSILRQLFCINFSTRIQSSQFTSHSTCFFRYTCIYIYTISNQHFKAFTVSTVATSTGLCATCTCHETRISFCNWLALAQVPATYLSPCMECLNVSNTETKYTHAYLLDLLCIPSTE